VSRKSKLKLYWSVIRPTAVYGCETWVLKLLYTDSQWLKRTYYGKYLGELKKIMNGIWRIKTNKELDELISTGT
jgi:hypothetical protein